MNTKYSVDLLTPIVQDSVSYSGVLRKLGLRQTGGGQSYLKDAIKRLDIDTSHFTGQATNSGSSHVGGPQKRAWQEVLIIRDRLARKEKTYIIRRAMVESGIPHLCNVCSISDEWNNIPLTLTIDHINGKSWDNTRNNVRFLCPNCHSQTDTFGSKNKGI